MLFLSSFTNTRTHTVRIQTHTYCRHRHTCAVRTYISLGSFFGMLVEVDLLHIYRYTRTLTDTCTQTHAHYTHTDTRTLHTHRHTHSTRTQTHILQADTQAHCTHTDTHAHCTHTDTHAHLPGGSSAELSLSLGSFFGVLTEVDVEVDFLRSFEHHFQSGCALKCASFT